jgi:hypothetical protein
VHFARERPKLFDPSELLRGQALRFADQFCWGTDFLLLSGGKELPKGRQGMFPSITIVRHKALEQTN